MFLLTKYKTISDSSTWNQRIIVLDMDFWYIKMLKYIYVNDTPEETLITQYMRIRYIYV